MAETDAKASPGEKPGTFLLYSNKPPEEARIFDLRGSDIIRIKLPAEEVTPTTPEELGITSATKDGVCKYCQLMLHPDAPEVTLHQPNLQSLLNSIETCEVCKWVEISIVRGSPDLVTRFQEGDAALCDPSSTTCGITISITKYPKHTRLVAVIGQRGFFVDSGVPLNISTAPRLGELAKRRFWQPHHKLDPATPFERMDILKNWLKDCLLHENCSAYFPETRNSVLPTRVLDLTGSADIPSSAEDITVRLRETSENEAGSYVALSYCWGQDPEHHFKLTRETLNQYKDGIDFSSLPLTQREAILAALYLGVRYVWIDSICIIQDSPEDWQVEAARMSSVYSNSLLTFAATSSNSPEGGLLNPFQSALCVSVHDETVFVRFETHETINNASEPLNTRGWTLQEAVLSPRLVCFGGEQWLWKCPSRYVTEDGLVDRLPRKDDSPDQWASVVQQGPGDDGKDFLRFWYRLVSAYSERMLTYQSDKLKAIAGLADAFARQTGYQYVAGLWAEDLAHALLWQTTSRGADRVTDSIPSWSWASVDGEVLTPSLSQTSESMLELIHVDQQWAGVPMSSQLTRSHLTVRGMMVQVNLGPRSVTQRLRYHLDKGPASDEIVGEAFLDNTSPVEQEISTVWCLYGYKVALDEEDAEHFTLLLLPVEGRDMYRRIGIGVVWKNCRFSDGRRGGSETLAEASSTTVVLV